MATFCNVVGNASLPRPAGKVVAVTLYIMGTFVPEFFFLYVAYGARMLNASNKDTTQHYVTILDSDYPFEYVLLSVLGDF